jgi:Tol biopolymer transport system component
MNACTAQRGIVLAALSGIVLSTTLRAQSTITRISLDAHGSECSGGGELRAGISMTADGRRIAFASISPGLVPGDTNGVYDVFVRDRLTGSVERCSVSSTGEQGDRLSGLYGVAISAYGRYVAFGSRATNLVAGDTNGVSDVFVRDLVLGTTERVSLDSAGNEGDGSSFHPALSADGRFVAFTSYATNLVPGDTNGLYDTFVRDRATGITERVSVDSTGAEVHDGSYRPSISSDGRYVAFESLSSELVAGDTNLTWDVFVHDRWTGITERESLSTAGVQGNDASWDVAISGDGRFVVFSSYATNLVPGDRNGDMDVFVRDRQLGTTQRVSVASDGTDADHASYSGQISADHRTVVFTSMAMNLSPVAASGLPHVFAHDLVTGATTLLSYGIGGVDANGSSSSASISNNARYVSFQSDATNIVAGDGNASTDVFVHDAHASGSTILCEPGVGSVLGCPCGNPPADAERGCDNSSSTGGASLDASGIAYLSSDTLTFTTEGELASALSTLFEGTTHLAAGTVFGHGVRCVGGQLVRLYTRSASAGSLAVPDAGAGETSISSRSAAKGIAIQPGVPTYFFVAYRDPAALGSCPASSTLNATTTSQIVWWP